ncbi:MAG TPA: hypothetical protein DEU95_07625 [Chloroflexi bacterium]|jgi:hypothetical protein|nr:hypothetical protein [Chloroflexota bacterium]HRA32870.1 hypothetical protein [Thermomicrobiales bacterium]
MTAKRLILAIVVALGIAVPATAVAESPSTINPSGRQTVPRTDGRYVVWLDYRAGDLGAADIYAADLATGEAIAVTTDAVQASAPAIDDGVVVWSEARDTPSYSSDIVGMNLATGERFDIATNGSQAAIAGGWVVWVSGTGLVAKNLAVDNEPIELASGGNIHAPAIDGDRITWEDLRPGGDATRWQLLTMRLGESEPTVIFEGRPFSKGANGSFGFDVADGTVVVIDTTFTLRAFDLAAGTETTAALPAYSQRPTTDGRYVFWEDHRMGATWVDLRGYDLRTASDFVAVSGNESPPIAALSPDVAGDTLVWSQGNDIDSTIHVAPVSTLLPTAPVDDRHESPDSVIFFPETGHSLRLGFRAFWQHNGNLPVFGFPLTEEFRELNADTGDVYTVQFTERQRFEYHPENAGTPYAVLLGRLGDELLLRQGRDWRDFPTADPSSSHFMVETGQAIDDRFWPYWSSHGLDLNDSGVSFRESLALFGFPLSHPIMETNADGDTVLTQYFERAVFEYHPQNDAPHDVLLRRLGAEALAARGWLTMTTAE